MKLFRAALILLLLLSAAMAALVYLPLTPPGEVFVDLPTGTGAQGMAGDLKRVGVIRSRDAFLLLRMIKGGRLKAGEYRFAESASAADVYARIAHGDVYTRAVTIPEGFNLFDIAGALDKSGLATRDAFLAAAHAPASLDLLRQFDPHPASVEGYLYPDTYRFSRHTSPEQMIAAMVRRFRAEAKRAGLEAAGVAGVSRDIARTVTLASLVEKEVHFDNERTMAAGVFENRLRASMPLQTDPTVIYAALLAGRWRGTIYRSDLLFDSPYNTYKTKGLPPGPICSPGAAALRAAMHPAATDALYFVADRTGHTQFSRTLAEHAEQVQSYRAGATP